MTARSVVDRSDTSSTTPDSDHGSTVIVSPTENQPSKNIRRPAMMSVRKRWPAKPTSTMTSDETARALVFPKPAICPIESTRATPNAT